MSFTFPKVDSKQSGYLPAQVDAFIARAREQFNDGSANLVTAHDVRNTEFDLIHGGYSPEIVDGAMDSLEDSFASREISRQKIERGSYAVEDRLSRVTELVQGRTERPKGHRFSRTGFLLRGYSKKQVDQLCEHIERHLFSGVEINLAQVRRVVFSAKRGGYVEAQVDAFIDRVVELLQLEQNR